MNILDKVISQTSEDYRERLYRVMYEECNEDNYDALVTFTKVSNFENNILRFTDNLRQDNLNTYQIHILIEGDNCFDSFSLVNCNVNYVTKNLSFLLMTKLATETRKPSTPIVLAVRSDYNKSDDFVPLYFTRAMILPDNKEEALSILNKTVESIQKTIITYSS